MVSTTTATAVGASLYTSTSVESTSTDAPPVRCRIRDIRGEP